MSLGTVFHALLIIAALLLIAHVIKRAFLSSLIVPSSLIAGVLALSLGPQLLGSYVSQYEPLQAVWINQPVMEIWKSLPSYLIVIVFAGLFVGKKIPSIGESLNQSLPNLGFGYTIAIGQYVVGMLATLLILIPLFSLDPAAGALIAVGFQGGHGTVAGLQSTFEGIGFAAGMDIGLGIATIGLISAIVLGTLMANRSMAERSCSAQSNDSSTDEECSEPEISADDSLREVKDRPIGLQFAILGSVIALAWMLLEGLKWAEQSLFASANVSILKYMPLFPVAMLVGLLVQLTLNKAKVGHWASQYQINLISNLALDILIVSALGSLDLSVLAKNWQALLILGAVGVTYSAAVYFALGDWYFKQDWKIRGIGELGQSMGTTAVGLLMLKQATTKPQKHVQAFSYKQPLYEPIVGGGVVTALAIPSIANFGAVGFTVVMSAVLLGIVVSFFLYKKSYKKKAQP